MSDENYFDYDQGAAEGVQGAMDTDTFVKLPFKTTLFSWVRGEATFPPKEGSGVKHYGGWKCSADNMRENSPTIPEKFVVETFSNQDGTKTYEAYCVRNLAIAPVAQRMRIIRDNEDPEAKDRPNIHILAYAGLFDQKTKLYTPWMPVILSVKGWGNKKFLEDAFKTWKDKTSVLRTTHAHGAPPNFFWLHLGTFTADRMPETVGRGSKKGYITPPRCFVPPEDQMTVDWLKRAFVGREMTTTMGQLLEEAKEWLDDWKGQNKPTDKPVPTDEVQPPDNDPSGDIPL